MKSYPPLFPHFAPLGGSFVALFAAAFVAKKWSTVNKFVSISETTR